tara:strand:+ start:212 stop:382 length:171 start_codon:yes stop_codon:yes gene_type:complete
MVPGWRNRAKWGGINQAFSMIAEPIIDKIRTAVSEAIKGGRTHERNAGYDQTADRN